MIRREALALLGSVLALGVAGTAVSASDQAACEEWIAQGDYEYSQRPDLGIGEYDENGPATPAARQELAAREAARRAWQRAFEVCTELAKGASDPAEAARLISRGYWALGQAHRIFRELGEASEVYMEGIERILEVVGHPSAALAPLYEELAHTEQSRGASDEIVHHYLREAFRLEEAEYGPDSPRLVGGLIMMAYIEQDDRGAEAYFQRILEVVRSDEATAEEIEKGLNIYHVWLFRHGRAGEIPAIEELRRQLLGDLGRGQNREDQTEPD